MSVVYQPDIVEGPVSTTESTSSSSASIRGAFFAWLSDGNAKIYSPPIYLSCFDVVSAYLIRRKISSIDLWELTKIDLFKSVYTKAINDNLFRATDKTTHTTFVQAGKDFLKFLKSRPAIKKMAAVSIEPPGQQGSRLTIKEAIIHVLENEQHGLTVEQIYKKIIADGLYSFGAKKPLGVVKGQIDRACVNSNCTSRACFLRSAYQ